MKHQIKHRYTGAVLFESDCESFRECVMEAVRKNVSLSGSDLSRSDLSRSNLSWSNLSGSDLSRSNLSRSNLSWSDLSWSNLSGSNLSRSNLSGSNLLDAKNIPAIAEAVTSILPDGDLVGWKKCRGDKIVKLRIPVDSKRSNATGRKCRCEFADVLEVTGGGVAVSLRDNRVTYETGKRVTCDKFDPNRWAECGGGIHFFITRAEAEAYEL